MSDDYFRMLRSPKYGYGKNFNPCIDCKIFLLSRARERMEEEKADFLVTGEVLGQRPMSQRRDTLRVIERDSGTDGLLLRPSAPGFSSQPARKLRGWWTGISCSP